MGIQSSRKGERPVEVAFYGGNFSTLEYDTQDHLLSQVKPFLDSGIVSSVRISTRPDSIWEENLIFLRERGVHTIELGVQSMDPDVLKQSGRSYNGESVFRAATLVKAREFQLGMQLMVGLPGDSRDKALQTAQDTISMAPDFVRIYPTLVLEGSGLAHLYRQGLYQPISLDEAVLICRDMVMLFRKAGIEVTRVGLQDRSVFQKEDSLLAGPHHPAFGQMVKSAIWMKRIHQYIQTTCSRKKNLTIHAAAREFSNIRGQKNGNIEALKSDFSIENVQLVCDESLQGDDFRLEFRN
jgi:histone acetyltransferase (RNA polymerase elongator complex component)